MGGFKFHMILTRVRAFFVVVGLSAAVVGCCAEEKAGPAKTINEKPLLGTPDHTGEKAEIGVELAAQLKEMGYLKKEEKKQEQGWDNPYSNVDIAGFFEGIDGTFVLYDVKRDKYLRHNVKRASTRFSPCSTFKIPNTLIGLETKAVADEKEVIAWDRKKYPKEPWWDEILKPLGKIWAQDHTLATAFPQSVVWYYKELAKRIGKEKMASYLSRFDYGNQDISSGIDKFWLGSSLLISADEQVEFLKKFTSGKLKLSPVTRDIAYKVFKSKEGTAYKLYSKTGTNTAEGEPGIGWYVGFVERGEDVYIFAFNMSGDWDTIFKNRVKTAKSILGELGILTF